MDWERFGCCENPFRAAFDERFFYPASHQRALFAKLFSSIRTSGAFSLLTASPGMGKTILLFQLATRLRRSAHRVAVFPMPVTSIESLATACAEIDKSGGVPGTTDTKVACQQLLLSSASEPRWVLIFDEAQALTDDLLAFLVDLMSAAGTTAKPPSVLLSGHPTLEERVRSYMATRTGDEVCTYYRLGAFPAFEIPALIHHRMEVAGCRRSDILSPESLAALIQYSDGSPARLLTLLNLALFVAEESGHRELSANAVEHAAACMLLDDRLQPDTLSTPIPIQKDGHACDHDGLGSPTQTLNERSKRPVRPLYRVPTLSLLGIGVVLGIGWLVLDQGDHPLRETGRSTTAVSTLAGAANGSLDVPVGADYAPLATAPAPFGVNSASASAAPRAEPSEIANATNALPSSARPVRLEPARPLVANMVRSASSSAIPAQPAPISVSDLVVPSPSSLRPVGPAPVSAAELARPLSDSTAPIRLEQLEVADVAALTVRDDPTRDPPEHAVEPQASLPATAPATERDDVGSTRALSPSAESATTENAIDRATTERDSRTHEQRRLDAHKVRRWLSVAEAHLEADRLVAPRFDNALYAYRKVLRIDPRNPNALAGLQAIRAKVERFAADERARGNVSGAQRQLKKLSLLKGIE